MPETTGGGAEIPDIELPSALRIRQRLGMIATSRSYSEALIPSIVQLAGQTMPAEELVASLESKTATFAETHMLGMERFVQLGIPRIIDSIIDDPDQKTEALMAWEVMVEDKIAADAISEKRQAWHYRRQPPSRHQTRRAKRHGR